MTNAEKQEIIEAVLAALATNSKTIAQLSPKQSLIDSDLFEVAGGSRVTYQVLRSLIREGLALESRLSDYVTGEQAMMYLAKLDTETGTVDYKESPLVMLDGFKGVNGYTPVTGDLYYENYHGYQIWIKKAGGDNKEGIVANPNVAYVNKNDGAIYRWTGSSMVRIGGSSVINDLTTGGEGDALSAEMGKKIRQNITILLSRLGEYAFPNGKPTLDWSGGGGGGGDDPVVPTYKVQKTIGTGLSASGGDDDVSEGDSLEVTISVTNNLYIIDEDNVEVTMDGSPVDGAFDAATGKITIAEVYGEVVINVPSMTYVSNGLAFQLDCKNRGGQSGHWIDLIGNIDFTLGRAVTAADSGVVFDGSANSYGETNSSLNIAPSAATIEAVVHWDSEEYAPILVSPVAAGAKLNTGLIFQRSVNKAIMALGYSPTQASDILANDCVSIGDIRDFALSFNSQRYINKGIASSPNEKYLFLMNAAHTKLTIGRSRRPVDDSRGDIVFIGTIKAIRVYNAVLTEAQQMQNWKVDQKRFNIS